MKPLLTALATVALLAHAAIFVLFLADVHRNGGAALHGGESGGRYWVAEHGRRTEVSAEDYARSRWLGIGVLGGALPAMAGGGYLLFAWMLPWAVYLRGEDDLGAAVKRVRGSGAPAAEGRTGGSLGRANFGGPMLRVSVHPGGLVVKPLWMAPFAVERESVTAAGRKRSWLVRRIEIEHRSPDVRSPIRFEVPRDPALAAALEGLNPPAGRPSGRAPGPRTSARSGRP